MSSSSTTIITAFYNLKKNKYNNNVDVYLYWISNFLPYCNSNMVIFTNNDCYEFIKKMRANQKDKTRIIILDIENFYTYKYLNYWLDDLNRDPERNIHNIELYMLWNEKCKFVEKTIQLNPFNTEYFIWTDIGVIRDQKNIELIKTYPNDRVINDIDNTKMYMLYIDCYNDIPFENNITLSGASEMFLKNNYVGGTIFFGHKDVFNIYIKRYYEMLDEFINNNFFAGKDQSIISCIYFNDKNLFKLIKPDLNLFDDKWFYLLYFFH